MDVRLEALSRPGTAGSVLLTPGGSLARIAPLGMSSEDLLQQPLADTDSEAEEAEGAAAAAAAAAAAQFEEAGDSSDDSDHYSSNSDLFDIDLEGDVPGERVLQQLRASGSPALTQHSP